jgi:hypothetical protein
MKNYCSQVKMFLFAVVTVSGLAFCQPSTMVELSASLDNTLYENAIGNTSNGMGAYMFVGKTSQASRRRALLQFDVAQQIPVNAIIDSVRLILHVSKTFADFMPISLHKVLKKWGEGNSDAASEEGKGASAAVGDATWLYSAFNSESWNVAGGDFDNSPSASQDVGGAGFYSWGSTSEMRADVQAWLLQPSLNFGWLLLGNEVASATAKRLDSRQNAAVNSRPKLVVYYSTASFVATSDHVQPARIALGAYPNPFNASIAIFYSLDQSGPMSIKVYDIRGKEIVALDEGFMNAGDHTAHWDGKDKSGRSVSSGTYMAALQTGDHWKIQKMMLVR